MFTFSLAVTNGKPGTGVGIIDPGPVSIVGEIGDDSGGSMISSVGVFSPVDRVGVLEGSVMVGDWSGVADAGTLVGVSGKEVGNAGMMVPFSKYSRMAYIPTARITINPM